MVEGEATQQTSRSRGMTEARRAKLEALKKREDLKDALQQKLFETHKQKTARGQEQVNEIIKGEVGTFIDYGKVTQENIAKLERNVDRKVNKKDDEAASVYSIRSQLTTSRKAAYEDKIRAGTGAFSVTGKGLAPVPENEPAAAPEAAVDPQNEALKEIEKKYAPENLTWAAVDQYSAMLHDCDSQGNWGHKIAAQMALRECLDKQVSDKAKRVQSEAKEETKYYAQMMEDMKLHQEQEEAKHAVRKEKNLKEKMDRQKQIDLEKERQKIHLENVRAEEQALVAKCRADIQKEAERQLAKKEQQLQMIRALQLANEKDQARKKEQAEADMIADQKAQAAYTEMVKKQEAERVAAMEARQAKQAVLLKRMQDTVTASDNKKSEEEARIAKTQADEADQRQAEIHLAKAKARQEMNDKYSAFLKKQMNEKVVRKEYAAQLKQLCAQIMENDQKRFEEEQAAVKEEDKKHWQEHKELLQKQIETKRNERVLKDGELTSAEYKINKPLLETVSAHLIAHHKEQLSKGVGVAEE